MQPVKPTMDMWSNRPAVPIQHIVPQEDDKNCQSTKYNEAVCTDKKCQATKYYKKVNKNCQTTNMQPVKPAMDM